MFDDISVGSISNSTENVDIGRRYICDDVWGVRPVELVERTVFVKIDALFSILFFRVLIELLLPNSELLLLRHPQLVWPKMCTASVGRK